MDEDETIDLDVNYVKHFESHVAHITLHLDGADNEHDGPSHPSYFPPCGFWSPVDKDKFFHALSVHSRLRPDLIAAEVPGKTVADVCVYLDMLAEASAKEPKKWSRSTFMSAVEVSDDWIEFEEKQASAMADLEPIWEAQHREARRSAVLDDKRRSLRKPKSEWVAGPRDRENEKLRKAILTDFQARREAEWEKEDYMRDLTGVHLTAIDRILREAEESSLAQSHAAVSRLGYGSVEIEERVSVPLNDDIIKPSPLDGAERQLEPAYSSSHEAETSNRNHNGHDAEMNVDLDLLDPIARRRHQKRMHMRRKRAEQSGGEVNMAATRLKPGRKTNKRLLRKLARQKAKTENADEIMDVDKKVQLAEAKFTISNNEEDENEGQTDVHGGKEEADISLDGGLDDALQLADILHDEDQLGILKDFRPATLPYRIKQELLDFGYNAATLKSEGLGLFHLSRFSDLMGLHASLQGPPNSTGNRISAALIKLFQAEVVCFVTDVIHRAIAICEQERVAKEHTKVWRLREEQVKDKHIHLALETMGAATSKKEHFSQLVSRMDYIKSCKRSVEMREGQEETDKAVHCEDGSGDGGNSDKEDIGGDAEKGNVGDEGGGHSDPFIDEDADNFDDEEEHSIHETRPTLPFHREIYAPFLWHAAVDHLDSNPYGPSQTAPCNYESSDDVQRVPDDSALLEELLEEEELDAADVATAKEMEAELWAKFASHERRDDAIDEPLQESSEEDEDFIEHYLNMDPDPVGSGNDHRQLRSLKFGKPNKRIKSSVFVEDNDSD
ncbi:uncharacterized protein FOMMEDRAFT_147764 [Fomitiporia mediterranea MF3/22]|uniref:uncharacterized protein n=1 Tax=Fomitiporia mediterranea (strain MF3/22) TaxID=694068 RepID=UPI00044091C7|nr:uncharacterized protein FOMMEDRAFT_147764 [Fomitiporia mediterranea MF3/22]EJD01151.1 hypothetical protein FOMMEDRAFT_147764 [Fomitiporia mediterranea MF3/22]